MIHIPGFYRHLKGGLYETMATAMETETGIEYVVYKSALSDVIWCRPRSMWEEVVRWPDVALRARFVLERVPQPEEAKELGYLFSPEQKQEDARTPTAPRATPDK
jgi:hypothetical protein